jgi:hypothetical protein
VVAGIRPAELAGARRRAWWSSPPPTTVAPRSCWRRKRTRM